MLQGEEEGLLGPQEEEEVTLRFQKGQISFCWEKGHRSGKGGGVFGDQRQRK